MTQHLTTLLRRALDDTGPEGTVALTMLRERLTGRSGDVHLVTTDIDDPLLDWVNKLKRENGKLQIERNRLREKVEEIAKRLKANAHKVHLDSVRLREGLWKITS